MINKKQLLKICMFVFLLVLVMQSVYGLGVAPARTLFNSGNKVETGQLRIINNQHKDMKVVIYATGEYKDYFKTSESIVIIDSSESSKTISYELNIPNNLPPGRNIVEIIILELPVEMQEGNTIITDSGAIIMQDKDEGEMISATTAVIAQLLIDIPYPGKYLVSNLHVNSANSGDVVTFTASLFGKGDQNINNVEGTAIIKGPTNEEITRVQTNAISLASGDDGKVVANWKADLNPGTYFVEMVVNFDGKQIVLSKPFMIGNKNLNIKDLIIDQFKLGQIVKVDVIAESVWNSEIKDVYAELNVLDSTGSSIKSVKTSSEDIPSLGSIILSGYWNTQDMIIGNYDINVKLFYEEKISEKLFNAVINADNIQVLDVARIGGQVIGKGAEGKSNTTTLLIVAVLALVIINVVWLVYFKKFKKK